MAQKKFTLMDRIRSFKYAGAGIKEMVRFGFNFWVQLVMAVVAIVCSIVFEISSIEWCLVIISIFGVLAAETVNTAIEVLCDRVSPDYDPLIGRVKDLAAGAVVFMALSSLAVGLIIFIPKIF